MDDLKIGIIIAQLINFGILFFAFKYFLGEKIVKAIEDRRAKIENLDASDDVVKQKLEEAEKEVQEILEKARTEALSIQQNAEELSKKDTMIKLELAEKKAEAIIESAKRNMEKEKLSMFDIMREKVLDLSLKINSKVFDDKGCNKEFISKEVNSVKL